MATLNLTVPAGADDGRWFIDSSSHYSNSESNVQIGYVSASFPDGNMWARFTGVSGLSGATINSATLTVRNVFGLSGDISFAVSAIDAASPSAPTSAADAEGRTRTTASVTWTNAAMLADTDYSPPSLVSVIQELADSYDPTTIVIYLEKTGAETNNRTFVTYETSTVNCARLSIDYTAGGGVTVKTLAALGVGS